MATIKSFKEIQTMTDEDGNVKSTVLEKTEKAEISQEPDYIKLYTRMWCEFNEIPPAYRPLFLSLVTRMTYASPTDINGGQIVHTAEPTSTILCEELGWKSKDSLMKGLKALCTCGAIKKINRAVYQINPSYAGRGEWKYNPRLERGGVENLITTFNFKEKTVESRILWANTDENSEINDMFRAMTKTKKGQNAIMTEVIEKCD